MAETPTPAPETTHHRVRRRRKPRRFLASVRRVWYGWWVEILVVVLTLLAVFLLVERIDIRRTLAAGLVRLLAGLGQGISIHSQRVRDFIQGTSPSDLIAYLLLLLVIGLVVWRLRWRLTTTPRFTEIKCPDCGSDLHRIRRRGRDRVLSLFVPVRRYQCRNHDCQWRGLRVQTSRHG
jgi:hypothetical protein